MLARRRPWWTTTTLLAWLVASAAGGTGSQPASQVERWTKAEMNRAQGHIVAGELGVAGSILRSLLTLPLPLPDKSDVWTALGMVLLREDEEAAQKNSDQRVREGLLAEAIHCFGEVLRSDVDGSGAAAVGGALGAAEGHLAALRLTHSQAETEEEPSCGDGGDGSETAATCPMRFNPMLSSSCAHGDLVTELDAFKRWCQGSNNLSAEARTDSVALTWSSTTGFMLRATRDILPGQEVFFFPRDMTHRGLPGLLAVPVGASEQEQEAMLARVRALSEHASLGRDVSSEVLFWQRFVDAVHSDDGNSTATGNPSSGLEPWLRTYRYASMWAEGWSWDELRWIADEPWASELHDTLLDKRVLVDSFCELILPTLRAEFPRQFPRNHFDCAGFEWCLQLIGSRAIWGGDLIPLVDTVNHDITGRANIVGDMDPAAGYSAHALRLIRTGELLYMIYGARAPNAHFLAHFDFVHPKGMDPGGSRVPVTADGLWRAFQSWGGTTNRIGRDEVGEQKWRLVPSDSELMTIDQQRRRKVLDEIWPLALAAHRTRWPFIHNVSSSHRTSLRGLADECFLALLGVLTARDPESAVQAVSARGWKPAVDEFDAVWSPAALVLRHWVAQTWEEVGKWLSSGGSQRPPSSLPVHRADGVLQIASEMLDVLRRARQWLGET